MEVQSSLYYALVIGSGVCVTILGVVSLKKPFFTYVRKVSIQLNIVLDTGLSEKERDREIIKNLGKVLYWQFIVIIAALLSVLIGLFPIGIFTVIYPQFPLDFETVYFYGALTLGSLVFVFFKKKGEYSYWSKLFHTVILENYGIGKFLLKRELRKHGDKNATAKFVVITGLARSGTTALTNKLFDTGRFHALTYANMPFLMAPKSWSKLYKAKSKALKERMHGDHIKISKNSIEALEEYFFKVMLNDAFVKETCLEEHEISDQIFDTYLEYQSLNAKSGKTIYLAKNNNLMLRLKSMRKHSGDFKVICLIREPVDHALSLKRQHELFVHKQSEDPFILDYMTWLGHYEFGLNQKAFNFSNTLPDSNEVESLDYWLGLWINYYGYVRKHLHELGITLMSFEELSERPDETLQRVAEVTEISFDSLDDKSFSKQRTASDEDRSNIDIDILKEANDIYSELMTHSRKSGQRV